MSRKLTQKKILQKEGLILGDNASGLPAYTTGGSCTLQIVPTSCTPLKCVIVILKRLHQKFIFKCVDNYVTMSYCLAGNELSSVGGNTLSEIKTDNPHK